MDETLLSKLLGWFVCPTVSVEITTNKAAGLGKNKVDSILSTKRDLRNPLSMDTILPNLRRVGGSIVARYLAFDECFEEYVGHFGTNQCFCARNNP